jgi:ATP-dependent protease ClpP protease subunit
MKKGFWSKKDEDDKTPNLVQTESKDSKVKQLYVIGEINEEISKDVIKTLFETDWKKEGYDTLSIYITSEGGYLKDCFAIIDAIMFVREAFNIHVCTFGLGECASAGFFIFLTGDTRILFPRCNVFVHEHITMFSESTYSQTKKEGKDAKMLYDTYLRFTADRLGTSITKAKNLLKKNSYLTASELTKFKIVTAEQNEKGD